MRRYLLNTRNNRVFRFTPNLARRPYLVELTPDQAERWEAEMERAAQDGRDPQIHVLDADDAEAIRDNNPDKDAPLINKGQDDDGDVRPPAEDLDPTIDVSTFAKPQLVTIARKAGLAVASNAKVGMIRQQLQYRLAEICHQQGKTPTVDPTAGSRREPGGMDPSKNGGTQGPGESSSEAEVSTDDGGGQGEFDPDDPDGSRKVGQRTYYLAADSTPGVVEKNQKLPTVPRRSPRPSTKRQ